MTKALFSADEWLRYTRHIQLPQIGASGQSRLKQSHALIIGAGGLGSPVSLYLAAAGVGKLTIVDHDIVDITNLQRQIIFSTEQVGKSKALCARDRLLALNPEISVEAIVAPFQTSNADELIKQADLIIDCTDNFTTRYLINDTCITHKKPWIFASIYQFSGQCALFTNKGDNACFRCLFPESPSDIEDCNSAGVMGVLPGLLGTIQANEAIKYLSGLSSPLDGYLMLVETADLSFRKIKLAKNTNCKACGTHKEALAHEDISCTTQAQHDANNEISAAEFDILIQKNNALLIDVRSNTEHEAFNLGGLQIPVEELDSRIIEVDSNHNIVCYCQTGMRSAKAIDILKTHNKHAKNLSGGISAYLKNRFHSKQTTRDAV